MVFIRSPSEGQGRPSPMVSAFGRKQQARMTMLCVIALVVWQYSNPSMSVLRSTITFDSTSRTLLHEKGDNMTSVDTAMTEITATTSQTAEFLNTSLIQQKDAKTIGQNASAVPQSLFFTWKENIAANFHHQIHEIQKRQKRHESTKNNRTQEYYEGLLQRLDAVEDWGSDTSSWTSVSPQAFQDTVKIAKAEMTPLVEQVHADCILWIVPFKARTGQRGVFRIKPKLQFQCNVHDGKRKMQDKPCSDANLCLVQTDLKRWNYNESEIPFDVSLSNTGYNENTANTANSANTTKPNMATLLTVVDSLDYLLGNKIWSCFLNKASFSLLSKRPFFIWIGKLDSKTLNRRNTAVVESNFGASCAPSGQSKNAVNYYKPIAFAALFHRQSFVHVERAYFLDADIYFNPQAEFNATTQHRLEDYFDLSPQASLLGSQNPSGKDENILINGGFLGLRRGEWIDNFAALWWFCRCGEKDQNALWLTLISYWSAFAETLQPGSFSYPGALFENYDFAWYGVMPHTRNYLGKLRETWYETREQPSKLEMENSMLLPSGGPQNIHHFDGGRGFFHNTTASSDLYTAPLELPNVLLLPLHSFQLQKDESNDIDIYPPLVNKLEQVGNDNSLLIHTKYPHITCAYRQCWPFKV